MIVRIAVDAEVRAKERDGTELVAVIKVDARKGREDDVGHARVDEEVADLAKHFGETKWTVSLEGTDRLYEYIRGGDNFTFEQLNANLKQYNFDRIIIAVTVMAYNIAHLDKIHFWFEDNKQENWEIYFNNVVATPAYLNP